MSDDEEMTLLDEYLAVEKAIKKCQDSHAFATPDERGVFMHETLAKIQHLDHRIETSDLFSPNEIADDIATPSLKYLLIAFTLGDFLLSMPSTIDTRAKYVHDAHLAFKRFLDRMDLLLLMNEEAKREAEGKEATDPAVQRQKKLQQFKREKLLREQLTALSEARHRAAEEVRYITLRDITQYPFSPLSPHLHSLMISTPSTSPTYLTFLPSISPYRRVPAASPKTRMGWIS